MWEIVHCEAILKDRAFEMAEASRRGAHHAHRPPSRWRRRRVLGVGAWRRRPAPSLGAAVPTPAASAARA